MNTIKNILILILIHFLKSLRFILKEKYHVYFTFYLLCNLQYFYKINLSYNQFLYQTIVAVLFYFIVLYIPIFKLFLTNKKTDKMISKLDDGIEKFSKKLLQKNH